MNDTFAMTEALPVSGRVCERGHLHHDLNMGFVEVVDADTGDPTAPGEIGSVVITPYYPYRECMPVFRYDTRDLVRRLPEEPLGCSLAAVPATSRILGKADQVVHIDGRAVMPRALVEACEGLPGEPWPARFTARAVHEGLELKLSEDTAGALQPDALARLIAPTTGDVPVHCSVAPRSAPVLRHVRADLLETTFTGREA